MTGLMRRLTIASLIAVLVLAASAVAAPRAGRYKGKIDYQGYDVTFQLKGGKVTKLVARMLQDCDRDGSSETITVAPAGSWAVKGGKVSGKKVEKLDKTKSTYILEGRFSGSSFKGSIREYDYVAGGGIVCDTLKRTFTARR
jgi:hypothetical protein